MNGKHVLFRAAKTVLTLGSPFQEKGLCDGPTLNPGDACAFSCSYCYVGPQMRKLIHGILNGRKHVDVVIRRRDSLSVLRSQLLDSKGRPRYNNPEDTGVVYSSTLVDVAGNTELMAETAALCRLVFELTPWQIRLLTKSNLLPKLVALIPEKWHQRLILDVSTGTFDDRIGKAIEQGTAPVSKRLASLHWLQDNGFRTFGMICPSLPQTDYAAFAVKAAGAIRVEKCEHVWAEVMNVRGDSLTATAQALQQGGFAEEAKALIAVMKDKAAWETYARATFEAHAKHIPGSKLRFMQYVTPGSRSYWDGQRSQGALLLGTHA